MASTSSAFSGRKTCLGREEISRIFWQNFSIIQTQIKEESFLKRCGQRSGHKRQFVLRKNVLYPSNNDKCMNSETQLRLFLPLVAHAHVNFREQCSSDSTRWNSSEAAAAGTGVHWISKSGTISLGWYTLGVIRFGTNWRWITGGLTGEISLAGGQSSWSICSSQRLPYT